MYNRLLSFINKHILLYKLQFGFREKHGTDTAIIIFIDKIMSAINVDEIVLGVFLDFSQAFDTVNHQILLMKMYKYGIKGIALSWFESYLSNGNQYVSFSNHNYESMLISCGVPQGSIWVHFCFCYMSMIWLMFLQFYVPFHLLMTRMYSFKAMSWPSHWCHEWWVV